VQAELQVHAVTAGGTEDGLVGLRLDSADALQGFLSLGPTMLNTP